VDPVPCPDGKLTFGEGSGDVSDCMPCPKGYFCKFATYFSQNPVNPSTISSAFTSTTAYGKCKAGFVCIGGSSTDSPIDFQTGYKCPKGYYCPEGTTIELPCLPGTYNPNE
jgi:hypothetical protein